MSLLAALCSATLLLSASAIAAPAAATAARAQSAGNRAAKLEVRVIPREGGSVIGAGSHPLGSLVELTAVPAPNYRFAGWRGAVTDPYGSRTRTFVNDETTIIEALFERELIHLVINTEPQGAGIVEGGGYWAHGSACPVSAAPVPSFVFAGWEGPVSNATAARTSLAQPLTKPVTLTARFTPADVFFTLTVSGTPSACGTVTGGGSFKRGQTVEIDAKPAPGFAFNGWIGPAARRGLPKTTVYIAADTRLTASFTRAYAIIAPVVEPENAGTVTGDINTQPCGIQATLTAKPAPGYTFAGWVGDVADKKNARTTFTPAASETYRIKALFIKQ